MWRGTKDKEKRPRKSLSLINELDGLIKHDILVWQKTEQYCKQFRSRFRFFDKVSPNNLKKVIQ